MILSGLPQTISVDISYMLRSIDISWDVEKPCSQRQSRQPAYLGRPPCHLLCLEIRMWKWVSILPRHQRERLLHRTLRMSQSWGYFPLTQACGHSLNLEKNPAQSPGGAVFVLHGSNSVHLARKDSHSTFTSSEKINCSLFSAFLP